MDKTALSINTYDKIAEKYSITYFDDNSDNDYLDMFLDKLPKRSRVLDIGCGPGSISKYMHEKGYRVEGIDLSDEMVRIAREKVPGVTFKKMDMRKMNYEDNLFDGILSAYSLIHIPSEEIPGTLHEFKRILKPGGIVMTITQAGEPDRIVDQPMQPGAKIFLNFFTRKRLADFLTEAGFKIILQKERTTPAEVTFSNRVIHTIAKV